MKKINSDIKIKDNPLFNVKIGTTDKKNFNVVYIEGKCYITPTEETESYDDKIKKIEDELKKYIKAYFFKRGNYKEKALDLFSPMVIFDVAGERASVGKETCFTIQIYYRRRNNLFSEINGGFKTYAEHIPSVEINKASIMSDVKNIFEKNGFLITKKVKSRKNA